RCGATVECSSEPGEPLAWDWQRVRRCHRGPAPLGVSGWCGNRHRPARAGPRPPVGTHEAMTKPEAEEPHLAPDSGLSGMSEGGPAPGMADRDDQEPAVAGAAAAPRPPGRPRAGPGRGTPHPAFATGSLRHADPPRPRGLHHPRRTAIRLDPNDGPGTRRPTRPGSAHGHGY